MLSAQNKLHYSYKNPTISSDFMILGTYCARYIQDQNLQVDFRKLKYDLIKICEILRYFRIERSEAFRNQVYYKLIARKENDPIDVIRHGLIHLDPFMDSSHKLEFYQAVLKILSGLAPLKSGEIEEIEPLEFDALDDSPTFRYFSRVREKSLGVAYVRHAEKLSREVVEIIPPILLYIKNALPENLESIGEIGYVDFVKQYKHVFLAITEVGEILNQIKNGLQFDSKSTNFKLYVFIDGRKVSLSPEVTKAFIDSRKYLHHLKTWGDCMGETKVVLTFIKEHLSQMNPSQVSSLTV